MGASGMSYLLAMSTPALAVNVEVLSSQWSLLDHAQEWSDFSQVNDQATNTWASSVVFEGMHCTACAINIEEALMAVPGVLSAQISAASHRGRIVWSAQTTKPSHWMKAVAKLGYTTLPANDALANEVRRADARKMLWRLGVAGLCMMQVLTDADDLVVASTQSRWVSVRLQVPFDAAMPGSYPVKFFIETTGHDDHEHEKLEEKSVFLIPR